MSREKLKELFSRPKMVKIELDRDGLITNIDGLDEALVGLRPAPHDTDKSPLRALLRGMAIFNAICEWHGGSIEFLTIEEDDPSETVN